MTYRNDLDALAAREAALAKEVAEKRQERDEVARQLAEAREWEAAAQRARGRRRRMFLQIAGVLVVALVVAGGAGYMLFGRPTISMKVATPRIYTCQELEPEHAKAEGDALRNYSLALAVKGLHAIELRADEIVLDGRSPEDLFKQFGGPLATGEVVPFTTSNGKHFSAYVGEGVSFDYGPTDLDFATDGHGGIWHVVRNPRVVLLRSVDSTACQWGCWGLEPPVAVTQYYHRRVWLLPDSATFRGEVTIDYDAPALDEHPTENCPPRG